MSARIVSGSLEVEPHFSDFGQTWIRARASVARCLWNRLADGVLRRSLPVASGVCVCVCPHLASSIRCAGGSSSGGFLYTLSTKSTGFAGLACPQFAGGANTARIRPRVGVTGAMSSGSARDRGFSGPFCGKMGRTEADARPQWSGRGRTARVSASSSSAAPLGRHVGRCLRPTWPTARERRGPPLLRERVGAPHIV